jgi:hypothetical protein
MKTLSTISAVLLFASACNTGGVQVTGDPVNSTSGPSSPVTDNVPHSEKPGVTPIFPLFFERVKVTINDISSLFSISFAAPGASQGSTPFGVALKRAQAFVPHPIFVPFQSKVIYLRSTGIGADSLAVTELGSMSTTSFFVFPNQVLDFALSPSQDQLAWVDVDGAVSVVEISNISNVTVLDKGPEGKPGIALPSRIKWSAAGNHVLVEVDKQTEIYTRSSGASPQWKKTASIPDANEAVFSPDGNAIGYFSAADHAIKTAQVTGDFSKAALVLQAASLKEVHDLSWSASNRFLYWTRLDSGLAAVKSTPALRGAPDPDFTIAELGVPSFVGDGVVCPTSVGSSVYYSDYADGEFIINQALLSANSQASVSAFATPYNSGELSEGYICPGIAAEGSLM